MRHEPKPEIENHPYIQSLIVRQEKRAADRDRSKNKQKAAEEREKEILATKPVDIIEFWCDECQQDFANVAYRQIETDWANSKQHIAFYKSKHDCGNWCIRHITDKAWDAYWFESIQVAQDRGKHYADLLQPFETGYQLLYGNKNK